MKKLDYTEEYVLANPKKVAKFLNDYSPFYDKFKKANITITGQRGDIIPPPPPPLPPPTGTGGGK